jgi:hypothetical protein
MAIQTLLWRGHDAPRMEIVRVESLDRGRGTQIGIAYELRWKLDRAVVELGPGRAQSLPAEQAVVLRADHVLRPSVGEV